MTITIEISELPPGLAVVVVAAGSLLAVDVGQGYSLDEIVAALGPALSRAINLTLAAVDA